ncbi:MAG: hypothetical protein AAF745_09130 [Planctomycetota bacterium]
MVCQALKFNQFVGQGDVVLTHHEEVMPRHRPIATPRIVQLNACWVNDPVTRPTGFSVFRPSDESAVTSGKAVARWIWLATAMIFFANPAAGQLLDRLDAYPPRWSLGENDCDSRIVDHGHQRDPAASGQACEILTLKNDRGTRALLLYPIEPTRIIDELTASVAIKSVQTGLSIGFRVRYPHLIDPKTRRPAATYVFGARSRRAGEFQRIGVGAINGLLKLRTISMRNRYGATADVSTPYADAVVIDAYCGPGNTNVALDDLKIDAMVPVGNSRGVDLDLSRSVAMRPVDQSELRPGRRLVSPFAAARVTRILQHQGEPLPWIRSLGFDAIWTSEFPSVDLLREAILTRMQIYSPPPTAPDAGVEDLLDPIAAWVIGADLPMDNEHRDEMQHRIDHAQELPARWQRPTIGFPVESFRHYGGQLDGVVLELPPLIRGIASTAVRRGRQNQLRRVGAASVAVSVSSEPPAIAVGQTNVIAGQIGSPQCEHVHWHAVWRSVIDSLADIPQAIWYRSSRSLTSGLTLDQNRALALSYINRQVASLESWISRGVADPIPIATSETHVGYRVVSGATNLLLLTSSRFRNDQVLAGDGEAVSIALAPEDQGKLIWRLTHFSAERITPRNDVNGTSIEIVSPDVVEVIAISDDIAEGGRLAESFSRFANQAATDRLQLVRDDHRRSQSAWQTAMAARVVRQSPPTELFRVSEQSIDDASSRLNGRQAETSLRLSRRADAWTVRTRWMLSEALRVAVDGDPDFRLWSSPPLLAGNLETQVAWMPLMADRSVDGSWSRRQSTDPMGASGWGPNLLAGGSLDRGDQLERSGWSFGRRSLQSTTTEASWTDRGSFAGRGALAVRVTPQHDERLPGGYEGTALMVATPSVGLSAGDVVRVDAMVRTIGFGQPHSGLLVHDTLGTQSLGILVRERPDWTPVTLWRSVPDGGDHAFKVIFEVLGGGEALIDEIQVRRWEQASL